MAIEVLGLGELLVSAASHVGVLPSLLFHAFPTSLLLFHV